MSELLNSIRPRIESLGIGFQFVKTIKTVRMEQNGKHGFWMVFQNFRIGLEFFH